MKGKVEQLDNVYCGPGTKKFLKRRAHKAMRKLGKQLRDEAPKKYHYSGWAS